MRFNTIKFKMSFLYTVLLGVILVMYSAFLFWSLYQTLYRDLDNELKEKVKAVSHAIEEYHSIVGQDELSFVFASRRVLTLKGEYPEKTGDISPTQKKAIIGFEKEWRNIYQRLGLIDDYMQILTSEGKVIVKSANLKIELHKIMIASSKEFFKDGKSFRTIHFGKKNLRLFQQEINTAAGRKVIFQVGTSQKPIMDLLEKRLMVIMLSIPVVLLLTSFVGRILVGHILKPVVDVTNLAQTISHDDLSKRISTRYTDDEMQTLIEAFNDMIERLEIAFQHIAEFSGHVAHELKTPLAIIQGESELALRKERSVEEYQNVLKSTLDEIQRMLKTIDDLLLLAKLESQPDWLEFETIEFDKFFNEIYEQSLLLVHDKDILVECDPCPQVLISGSIVHLRRMFFNLIHNAMKFTPQKGRIHFSFKQAKDMLQVSIHDSGVGIPENELEVIFNRFYHVDRIEGQEKGNGLGLSIVEMIVRVHEGQITVQSTPQKGTTFIVTLPIA